MSIGRHMTSGLSAMDAGIDDVAFARLAAILHSECGIVLSDSKKSLAVSRLSKRLRQVGALSFILVSRRFSHLTQSTLQFISGAR